MGAVIQFCSLELGHGERRAGRSEALLLPACGFSSSTQSQLKVMFDCHSLSALMGTDCPTAGIGVCV